MDIEKTDEPLVERWLKQEHVRRWWGDQNISDVLPHKVNRLHTLIIEVDGRRVGLVIIAYPTQDELDSAGLSDISDKAVDIDIMIGEKEDLGKGVGSQAISIVADNLLKDESVPYLIACPSVNNIASIRIFKKAGFSEDRRFDDPEYGRSILMKRDRT